MQIGKVSSEAPGLFFFGSLCILILALPLAVGWGIVGFGRRVGYRVLAVANGVLTVLYCVGVAFHFNFPLFVLAFVIGFAILGEWRYRELSKLQAKA